MTPGDGDGILGRAPYDAGDRREGGEGRAATRARASADTTPDALVVTDLDGRVLSVSPRFERWLGFRGGERGGGSIFERVLPEDRDALREAFEQTIETGEGWAAYRARAEDGTLRHLQSSARIFRDSGGQELVSIVVRDVTARVSREAERRELELRLHTAQKLESLGLLTGGVVHDFNNILVSILGNAELAYAELPADSRAREHLQQIVRAGERASELARQMLAYAGLRDQELEDVDLGQLVRELGALLAATVPKNVHVHYDLEDGLPPVRVDPAQMWQVVINFVTNAWEAIGENPGIISVKTGVRRLASEDFARCIVRAELRAGLFAYLEVTDTGGGIDPAVGEHLFDPEFSTKLPGRGLGLTAVSGIVRRHGGGVEIYSRREEGTRMRVWLPVAARAGLAASAAPRAAPRAEADAQHGSKPWILVVDDEDGVRDVARVALERAGFRVLTASDGREAADVFRARASDVSAVLLDLTMPRMGGRETFDALRATRADVPIVLTSGYGWRDVQGRIGESRVAGFLQKPFSASALVARMRAALQAR